MNADALICPRRHFTDRTEHDLRIPMAAICGVFTLAVLGALGEALLLPAGGGTGESQFFLAAAVGFAGVVVALCWKAFVVVYYALSFHLLTELFEGDGPLTATLAIVGWGFVPKLVHETFRFLETVWMIVQVHLLDVPSYDAGTGIVGSLVIVAVAFVMLCWSAYIWFGGLQGARNVDGTGAAVAVGLPLLGAFVLFAVSAIGRLVGSVL